MTWQDPYGQYGQNPYGQPGWQNTQAGWQDPYGAQQQGYGYYGPPGARGGGSNGAAVGALVANIACAVLCCGGIAWLPGIILAAISMNRVQSDPDSARQLTMWSWVCFALNIVLAIVLIVILAAIGAFSDSTTSTP